MRSVGFVTAAILSLDCASSKIQPVAASAPASYEVDFSEIKKGQCNPELEGYFLSNSGAIDMVRGIRRIERDYKIEIIHKDTEVKICQTKLESASQELAENSAQKTWALIGKLSTAGIASALIVGGFIAAYNAISGARK